MTVAAANISRLSEQTRRPDPESIDRVCELFTEAYISSASNKLEMRVRDHRCSELEAPTDLVDHERRRVQLDPERVAKPCPHLRFVREMRAWFDDPNRIKPGLAPVITSCCSLP